MSADASFDSIEISQAGLFERLEKGHQLVTGNNRLARVLHERYARWRSDRGDRQWASARITPWSAWLDELWDEAVLAGVDGTTAAVCNTTQATALWQTVIRDRDRAHEALHGRMTARQLHQARMLLREWKIDSHDPAWRTDNENVQAFVSWNGDFGQRCSKDGWLPQEDRMAILERAARQADLKPTGPLMLMGFDELYPAQQDLLAAIERAGIKVNWYQPVNRRVAVSRWEAEDERSELEMAVRWARHWLETETDSEIAIAVPDLAARHESVEQALQDILDPGRTSDPTTQPWNLSLGPGLDQQDAVRTAFAIFRMLEYRCDISDVARVLRSAWLRGSTSERTGRSLLEQCLRRKYPRTLNLAEIHYRAGQINDHVPAPWHCPELARMLQALRRFERTHRDPRSASEWARKLDELLTTLGWPRATDRTQSSLEWQVLQAWRE
ncbi:MAG: hypothetical protein HKN15_11625, partial [Xanthomonadales bacterium]|nr:hypothetical protein [Xanthomonadales bacterium]